MAIQPPQPIPLPSALWLESSLDSSSSSGASDRSSHSKRRCKVPGCPIQNCRLTTHKRYSPPNHNQPVATPEDLDHNSELVLNGTQSFAENAISRDGVDGLPTLPINERLDPDLRALFHHFFSSVFERLARTFRGPSVASMPEYKQRMLETALSSEGYCMGLIVQSNTDMAMARGPVDEDRKALEVYVRAVKAFRKQLVSVQRAPQPLQIELALLTLCTLITYDVFHQRELSVRLHWSGLQQLVASRGGLHMVTVSLAYVVHVDRLCALRLNSMPAFFNPSIQKAPALRPLWSWYGSKLLTLNCERSDQITTQVVSHCIETSGLLGLWEVSMGERMPPSSAQSQCAPPSLEYLHYMRDRIDEQFTTLHAEIWNRKTRDKYILWAARIVEYPCTWSNYIPTVGKYLCESIVSGLQGADIHRWTEDGEVLTWILFVLAVAPTAFKERDWVIKQLRILLGARLGGPRWPRKWQDTEVTNLRGFVWCDSMYKSRFAQVCHELEDEALRENISTDAFLSSHSTTSEPVKEDCVS